MPSLATFPLLVTSIVMPTLTRVAKIPQGSEVVGGVTGVVRMGVKVSVGVNDGVRDKTGTRGMRFGLLPLSLVGLGKGYSVLVEAAMEVAVAMRLGVMVGESVNVDAVVTISVDSVGTIASDGKTVLLSQNKANAMIDNPPTIPAP